MIIHWDRAGQPIEDTAEWASLFEIHGYRFVALDVEDDRRVSTIWEGVDRSFGRLPTPMIFQSAYFVADEMIDSYDWPSEEAALAGHALMCQTLLGRPPRPEDGHLARVLGEEL